MREGGEEGGVKQLTGEVARVRPAPVGEGVEVRGLHEGDVADVVGAGGEGGYV